MSSLLEEVIQTFEQKYGDRPHLISRSVDDTVYIFVYSDENRAENTWQICI